MQTAHQYSDTEVTLRGHTPNPFFRDPLFLRVRTFEKSTFACINLVQIVNIKKKFSLFRYNYLKLKVSSHQAIL